MRPKLLWIGERSQAKVMQERLEAADEVCWTLIVMMQLGGLDIPFEERKFLMDTYGPWVQLAVESGDLPSRDPYEESDEDATESRSQTA
jgi:hypothetical protein